MKINDEGFFRLKLIDLQDHLSKVQNAPSAVFQCNRDRKQYGRYCAIFKMRRARVHAILIKLIVWVGTVGNKGLHILYILQMHVIRVLPVINLASSMRRLEAG